MGRGSAMNERDLFIAALQKEDPAERSALLDAQCADDGQRRRVEALLRAYQQASQELPDDPEPPGGTGAYPPGSSALPPGAFLRPDELPHGPVAEGPGSRIGPYKLLQQIGEGGMGIVYLAEQEQPVRRRVAFKIIKPGMDSRQVIARFEAERQALAMMDHTNIAHVLDAGTTDTGRPYFVMELVHGEPITKFCDDRKLTPRERLELFVPVCQAIQHAHTKGIIHRDIKPSNVLVTLYDDKPVPKVIDFGLAKALDQRLTDKTLFTQFGAMVGTAEYMSPEQAQMNAFGVDTRSDIYSLGVLLYELLTGTTPLERKRLRRAALDELLRLIREEEPPRPSVRLSSSDTLPTLAEARRTEPARLSRLVRGELDWIVMKCLEKDRTRRYETANGLARDVERYLHDEPVEACPPGAGYRFRKLVRKHRRLFATAAAFAVLVLVGSAVSVGLAVRAMKAEGVAQERLGQVEEEKRRADAERAIAEAVSEFLQKDLLGQADIAQQPGGEGGRDPDVKVREVLDRAARGIEGKFVDQPLTEAAIRLTIGNVYEALGLDEQAQAHLERSVQLRTAELGADHPDTLTSKYGLVRVYLGQDKYQQAERLGKEVVQRRTAQLGADHPDTLRGKLSLASVYFDLGKYDQAEPIIREVVKASTARLGADHPDTLRGKNGLAAIYLVQGKYQQAGPIFKELLNTSRAKWGEDHPYTLLFKNNVALVYRGQKKYDQAEPLLREVLKVFTSTKGPEHPHTLYAKYQLALLYQDQGKYEQAEQLYQEVLRTSTARWSADHPVTVFGKRRLTSLYQAQGKYDQADPLFRDLVAYWKRKGSARGTHYAGTLRLFGYNLLQQQKDAEAEPILRECLAILEKERPDDWRRFVALSLLGGSLLGQKKYAEAEPLLLQGYEGMKQREDKIPPTRKGRLPRAAERLVKLYEAWDKKDEADRWRAELARYPQAEESK
jgi:serine/threonine protein kinase/tetratricopeptide (TPR) repeat protein